MSLDPTGSNADNPDNAGLNSVESPLAASSVPGPSKSTHASPASVSVSPSAYTPASPSISTPAGPSVTAPASPSVSGGNPSVSAPANPSNSTPVASPSISMPFTGTSIYIPVVGASVSTPVRPYVPVTASPSAHKNHHHSNTPPPNNIENVADQGQVNNTEDITQTADHQQPRSRRHPLLGQRQAPFTGSAETYDYTQMYEEDEPYMERSPNARVWKVYNHLVTKIDSDRVEDWRDGLDSLLVFAALFSAVITTFVAQTSLSLQKDWGEVTANLMVELILVQRAWINGISVNTIPSSQLTPSSNFTPRPVDVAINALWFFSLALSLSTALAAIVCKQWIHQYTIMSSTNSPLDQAHIRHFRFMGLEKWHVAGIIGLLPTFVHLSLGVFFGGLVIFLHDLSSVIGGIVDVVIALTSVLYTIANLLPLKFINCPYKTPLTSYTFHAVWGLCHIIGKSFHREAESLVDAEKEAAKNLEDNDCSILSWLMKSSNNSVQKIAMGTLGLLSHGYVDRIKESSTFDLKHVLSQNISESINPSSHAHGQAIRALHRLDPSVLHQFHPLMMFPLPDLSLPSSLEAPWQKPSDWEPALEFILSALTRGDQKRGAFIWCAYLDFLENTSPKVFLHQYSKRLGKDIFWKMAQSVSSAISVDGLERTGSYNGMRWLQYMFNPSMPLGSQRYNFEDVTLPCTIWEFLGRCSAPFLLQHILPVLKETYDDLIPPSPLVKKDLESVFANIPDHLFLWHYVAITPVVWKERTDVLSAAMYRLVELALMEGEEHHENALEVLVVTWTWILFCPDLSDNDLIHNGDTTGNLLAKSFGTLHTFDKNSIELVTRVSILGIAAATHISNSSRAEELAWSCFKIMSQKLESALAEHPQWIPPLWKTLNEQKVLSISVETMRWWTRYYLYEVQQKYLAGFAPLQRKSLSEGEEVFREEAIAYISGKETEPLTSLLRSSFFGNKEYHDGTAPREVPYLQESLHSLEWLAQLKNSENERAYRIPKEKWLPCLKEVEDGLENGSQNRLEWEKEFKENLRILRDFRRSVEQGFPTQVTTLPLGQQAPDSRPPRLEEPKSKHFTFRIPSPFKRTWRRLRRSPDGRTRDDDLEAGRPGTSFVEMQSMSVQPQNGSDDNLMGQMEGGSGTGSLAADGQEGLIEGPPNDNAPPAEIIHDTLQLDAHVDEARMTHVGELGRPDRDEAPPPTISLHKAQRMDQVDAGNSVEARQLGMDASRDNGSNVGDGNEMVRTGPREDKQVGSSQTEDAGRKQTEEELNTEEVVGMEQLQTPDKPGNRLSDVRVEGGKKGGRSEDTGEAGESKDKSDHSQPMGDRSRAEDDRTEGKGEGTEMGMVADSGTSKMERHVDDGKKIETGSVPMSGAILDIPGAGEPAVDKGGNRDTDTEQRVAGGTGGKEDDVDTGGLVRAEALQKEDDGNDGVPTAVTGMLPTISSLGDEDPMRNKDGGNETTNNRSQGEVDRTDRESLDTTDSPGDGSKDDTTHAGSSRGGSASGADIAG